MQLLHSFSIATKLKWNVTSAISLALVLACLGFLGYDDRTFRSAMVDDVKTLAEVVGSNSTGALSFQDAKSAEDVLKALDFKEHISEACIYDRHGSPFAKYLPPGVHRELTPPSVESDISYFPNAHTLVVFRDIMLARERIGTVYIRYDLAELNHRRVRYLQMMMLVALTALMLALLVSSYLLRSITRPIRRLAAATRVVSLSKEYSVPVIKHSDDEIGELIDGFNDMLAQIRRRDRVLEEAKEAAEATNRCLAAQASELALSRDAAERANGAKSIFLANMSHELRTPLNAILGYAQLLKRDRNLSSWQVNATNTIEQSGEHLLMLITDILDFSKIEAGKIELQVGPVDMSRCLQGIASIIAIKAEEKSLDFQCHITRDLPAFVQADQKRLRQILLNLLSNAVKFTDKGHVDLRVNVVSQLEGRVQICFEVRDSGVGLEEWELKKIFQPFEQVGDLQHRAGGTGLGLSISQQLARLMGSEIRVQSLPEKGSCFSFEMIAQIIGAKRTAPPASDQVTCYRGPRKRVMVVDDTAVNLAGLTEILASLGFDVSPALSLVEAMRRADAPTPDLILMEIGMPGMSSLDVIRRIQEIPNLRDVPIVTISATEDDKAGCLMAGAKAFLTKPIEEMCLFEEIGRLLDLTWIGEHLQPIFSLASGPVEQFVVPESAQMDSLRELAKAGNMRDIRERANHLASLDARYHPFTDRIIRLALGYQSKALLRFVEKYANQRHMEMMEKS